MVSVKRLTIQGFKSFGKFTPIEFPSGFTAIVGPNGSGKSNVIDSLCFVLGRTSIKSLRADRLTELIFNGGQDGNPATRAEVGIKFDNSSGELPLSEKEVEVVREIHKDGKSVYRINGKRTTRAQIADMLSKARISSSGHNIILQGDVARIVEMNALQRREIIDEICGIAEYEDKKNRATRELEKVQGKIGEAMAVYRERKRYLDSYEKERNAALRYQDITKKLKSYKGEIYQIKIKKAGKELKLIRKDAEEYENNRKNFEDELREKEAEVKKQEEVVNKIDSAIAAGGETEYQKRAHDLKVGISTLKERKGILDSQLAGKTSLIKQLEHDIEGLKLEETPLSEKIAATETERNGLNENLVAIEAELKTLETELEELPVGTDLVTDIKSGIGEIGKLIETKKTEAKGLSGSAADIKTKFGTILGSIKKAVGELEVRIETFGQDNADLLDKMDLLKKKTNELGKMQKQVVELDNKISSFNSELENVGKGSGEKAGEIVRVGEEKTKLEAEIGKIAADLGNLETEFKGLAESEDEKSLKQRIEKKKKLTEELNKVRGSTQECYRKIADLERNNSELAARKATIETRMTDLKEEYPEFEGQKIEIKHGESELERLIGKYEKELAEIGSVNMLAIEAYDKIKEDFDELVEKMEKLEAEKVAVEKFMEEIEEKKKDAFMTTFLEVLDKFEKTYGRLDPGGEAHLILENPDSPFEAGMEIQVRPRGKELINIDALSGGEKTMTALAFIFAIQQYRPAPFYILDEVDAALDKVNSQMLGEMLAEYANSGIAQFIIITHNDSVLEKADRLYGVTMTKRGSQIVGVEIGDLPAGGEEVEGEAAEGQESGSGEAEAPPGENN